MTALSLLDWHDRAAPRPVLCLDLARKLGWCVGVPGAHPDYGTVELQGPLAWRRLCRSGALDPRADPPAPAGRDCDRGSARQSGVQHHAPRLRARGAPASNGAPAWHPGSRGAGLAHAALAVPVVVSGIAAAAAVSPDAELIRVCEALPAVLATIRAAPDDMPEDDPLWLEYDCIRDAITDMSPLTMAGVLAKARACFAHDSGRVMEGEAPDGMAAIWAWDIVHAVTRMEGAA